MVVCEWCAHIVRFKKWMPCVLNPFHYWSQRRKVKNVKFTSSIKNHSFSFYPHTFWHQERDGCGGRHKNAAVRKLLRPLSEHCWRRIATVGGKRHEEPWVQFPKASGAVHLQKVGPSIGQTVTWSHYSTHAAHDIRAVLIRPFLTFWCRNYFFNFSTPCI